MGTGYRLRYNNTSMDLATDIAPLVRRLMSFVSAEGGLPYYRGGGASVEPTLLTLLALSAAGALDDPSESLLSWVAGLQNADGSVGVGSGHRDQGVWLTAPAAIVFHRYSLKEARNRALDFVIALKSVTVANDPNIKQDNTLVGWPWVPGTFGWVEPTAWSVAALDIAGSGRHARAVEGRKFLLDRQIPSGGWNYGNPGVNDTELLPFWDTTGLALVALRGDVDAGRVRPSLDLLEKNQERIESLCGLAWATLGLESYGREASGLKRKLLAAMNSAGDETLNTAHFAAGLIALSGKKVFLP
jgi:hypothetical protein